MIFYKGAISYDNIQNMSIPEILNYSELAVIINKEEEKAIEKIKHGKI